MKKYFFLILFFCFIFSNVSALVVQDIQQQIESGNEEVLRSNAELTSQITALKNEVQSLSNQIKELKETSVTTDSLPEIYGVISDLNHAHNSQILATFIIVFICAFAFQFLCKAKGWL